MGPSKIDCSDTLRQKSELNVFDCFFLKIVTFQSKISRETLGIYIETHNSSIMELVRGEILLTSQPTPTNY